MGENTLEVKKDEAFTCYFVYCRGCGEESASSPPSSAPFEVGRVFGRAVGRLVRIPPLKGCVEGEVRHQRPTNGAQLRTRKPKVRILRRFERGRTRRTGQTGGRGQFPIRPAGSGQGHAANHSRILQVGTTLPLRMFRTEKLQLPGQQNEQVEHQTPSPSCCAKLRRFRRQLNSFKNFPRLLF